MQELLVPTRRPPGSSVPRSRTPFVETGLGFPLSRPASPGADPEPTLVWTRPAPATSDSPRTRLAPDLVCTSHSALWFIPKVYSSASLFRIARTRVSPFILPCPYASSLSLRRSPAVSRCARPTPVFRRKGVSGDV